MWPIQPHDYYWGRYINGAARRRRGPRRPQRDVLPGERPAARRGAPGDPRPPRTVTSLAAAAAELAAELGVVVEAAAVAGTGRRRGASSRPAGDGRRARPRRRARADRGSRTRRAAALAIGLDRQCRARRGVGRGGGDNRRAAARRRRRGGGRAVARGRRARARRTRAGRRHLGADGDGDLERQGVGVQGLVDGGRRVDRRRPDGHPHRRHRCVATRHGVRHLGRSPPARRRGTEAEGAVVTMLVASVASSGREVSRNPRHIPP